ncbi:LINE-1 reverse transcriptase-like [Vitis vinifera]|uniref:LINE-1 reverse transcriptase-like n=1 Tax=Vitis vinifera TaxID=29760 RepID=A0A438J6P1_VITVI|nr:LINE-1 reverse transcriptase-like [Vitis vinifera]
MIRYPEERSRGGELSASMRRFTEVVEDLELRDYPLQGGLFTWRGGLNNQSQSRLDRFLVTDEWDRMFNGAMQGILARPVSDHFPILLEGGGLKRGPSPFRFENMCLKRAIKDLEQRSFGVIETKKREALSQVVYWDAVENHSTLSLEDCEARKEAQEAYKTWVLREEISWRQRSRELWLKEGDNNTKFFHRMANAHSRRNWLSRLKVDDCWHTEELELKNSVVGAFNNLYTEEGGWRPDLGKDKAPGPDGFTMAFWSFSWDLVKAEIMGFFKEFHERGRFVKSLNATFLVLVPKRGGAEDLKDFRPISLVESQNAFVEGRQILDAVLIANEAVDSRLKDNVGGVLCKLDIEKAYDRVSWSFLMAVLKEMGFGERWIKWIDWCISTVKFSVLVNGSPSGFFQSTRGLRQGDPLSPYLFVIAMEVFSSMMRRAISGGYLAGWKVSGGRGEGMHISHLLFADDTLVFCEDSPDEMTYLSWLLMWFEACSGLRINLEKSEIIPVGRVLNIEGLALELGCKVGGFPSSYLGMPLGQLSTLWRCGMGLKSVFVEDLLCGRGSTYLKGNAWVSDVWNPVGDGIGWTPLFARAFNDWEIILLERLLQKIQAVRVQREEEDRVIWTASKDGSSQLDPFIL